MDEHKPSRSLEWLVWGSLTFVILAIVVAFTRSRLKEETAPLPVIGTIANFSMTNQNNQPVTLADLRGEVWIADIIFTRCAGPCPEMTRKMSELQSDVTAKLPVKFVTLTTDSEYDTPPVLKRYGEKFGADAARWTFLTGAPLDIYKLAVESLKLTAMEKLPEQRETPVDLFVHSTMFVIVDKQGRLRGAFDTTGEMVDWPKMKTEIVAAAKALSRESK